MKKTASETKLTANDIERLETFLKELKIASLSETPAFDEQLIALIEERIAQLKKEGAQ